MSMFFCARCDNLRDSDDGCEEAPGYRLWCIDCADEEDDPSPSASEKRE